jgi:hypothetical protein
MISELKYTPLLLLYDEWQVTIGNEFMCIATPKVTWDDNDTVGGDKIFWQTSNKFKSGFYIQSVYFD